MPDSAPYASLQPDLVLGAIESAGFECDGTILPLASYENRVYQVGTADGFTVAKFYRPGRWSNEAILEEHAFACELDVQDFPIVAPLDLDGRTLHEYEGYRFALFERRGGRWPELASSEDRIFLGRVLGRLHAIGAVRPFAYRSTLSVDELGRRPAAFIMDSGLLPSHLVDSYQSVTADLLEAIEHRFALAGDVRMLRIHGDCHRNNVLWTDFGPHFVDLDDCLNGPAVQDLWLFLAGLRDEMTSQLGDLLEGYTQFRDFDFRELHLIEALRTLRIMHYAAWLARRWDDPAFPRAFPWFDDAKYWEEHILALREQQAVLDEPPLEILCR